MDNNKILEQINRAYNDHMARKYKVLGARWFHKDVVTEDMLTDPILVSDMVSIFESLINKPEVEIKGKK
jgi:hypothetical protein